MVPFTKKKPVLDIITSKIHTLESIEQTIATWKFLGDKIVFTNGCFDIIHRGHIDYLSKASDLANKLIVGLNSDESVRKLNKANSRPIQDEQSRAIILASLHFVSAVIIFNEDTPLNLIEKINPNVLVKGADYDENIIDKKDKKYIVGSDIVKTLGGEVKTIEFLEGYSTTVIEEKIKKA